LGKTRAFWWDELADLLLRPGRLPDTLELTARGRDLRWTLDASVQYGEHAYARHSRWAAMMQEPPTERQAIYLSLWELMLPLSDDEQRLLLDAVAAWSGTPPTRGATHRMLSEGELMSLGGDGLIEIGAHSVTHSVLPSLPLDAQRREVCESKRALEALIEKPVGSFSYPYGRTSEPTLSVVRDAGFDRACSTRPASVTPHGDPFDLPRIAVRDCNGDQFATMLNGVFQ
jgi:peptidoglycan/xylan/chitin deacetylase (PgdA/CDA1 family)